MRTLAPGGPSIGPVPLVLAVLVVLSTGLSLALTATPATGKGGDCHNFCTGTDGDDTATVTDWLDGDGQNGDTQPVGDSGSGEAYDGPFYQYKYVINCGYNSPENPVDVMCMGATAGCADGELRYRVYRREVDRAGQVVGNGAWQIQGSLCRGPDDPDGVVQPEVTTDMVVEEARRTAPRPVAHVEPATKSFVNVPNNFYADAESVDHTVHLFGNAITISFRVAEVSWDFGDGTSATGNGVENASVGQAGAVEHEYTRQGSYDVTVSTSLTVVFTLPNGRSVTLDDAITQTSPPVTLQVGEIQTTVNDVG